MYFSDHYQVPRPETAHWFDPILENDTKLFVDPFLIFKDVSPEWADAHDELIEYFQMAYDQLAPVHDNPGHPRYHRVLAMMTFPEPREFGLGYVGDSQDGSGTGRGFAAQIVNAMSQAIDRGLADMRHFEELGLLVPRINRDRISDIACNVLKPRFIAYTQQVCDELGIEMEPIEVPGSEFDANRYRWVAAEHWLPRNPTSGRAAILTPRRFLNTLPTLNAHGWWEYAESSLRDDFNLHIAESVDKDEIIRLARLRSDLVREWTGMSEDGQANPYDLDRDPGGIYQWDREAHKYTAAHPLLLATPSGVGDVNDIVLEIIRQFKRFVELQGGWRLLWNDAPVKPKREEAVQLLFKGIVQYYCEANNIALDREVELGRGPVDFVITKTRSERVLMEIKKMTSGRYWNGLEDQLTSYMESDNCRRGWFLAVRYKDTPLEQSRTTELPSRARAAARETGFELHSAWIDARPRESASKIG